MRETSRLAPGLFYFLQADDTHADRAFDTSPEGGRHHHYCVQQIGILFHLYLDERG